MNVTLHSGPYQKRPLGEVADVISGFAFKSTDFGDKGIPVIKIKNIRLGHVDLNEASYVDEKHLSIPDRFHVKSGDVLISLTGSHITQPNSVVGRIARHSDGQPRCLLNQRAGKIIAKDMRVCDPRFLFYALSEQETMLAIAVKAHGAASQANVSPSQVESIEIAFPPLPVQQRIAGILSAYDKLIENSQRRIKILEAMARGLYREWFVHFRFPGHENHPRVASALGEIPQGWEVRSVKDVAAVTYGFPFQSKKFNTNQIGSPVIRIRDILDASITTFTDELADAKYHIKNGDILVGMDGDFHMCIWSSGHALQNQRVAKFESSNAIGNHHLFLALELPIQIWNKSIVGTTVAHLGDMHIKAIQIVWPTEQFLSKANRILEPMAEQIIALKRQIQNLRRTRDLLLPRLLSGQINVEAP